MAARLLTSDVDGSHVVEAASGMLRQLVAFGRLGANAAVPQDRTMAFVRRRVAPAIRVFEALEREVGLRFDDAADFPFAANRIRWGDDAPPAGHTRPGRHIRPADVAISLGDAWCLQSDLGKNGLSPVIRRCALWHCATADLKATLDWTLDLLDYGYVLAPHGLAELPYRLLTGRTLVDSDRELALRANEGRLPSTWWELWSSPGTLTWTNDANPERVDARLIEHLLGRCLERIERVRGAVTMDDWVTGQCTVYGVVWVTQVVLKLGRPKSLALRAIESQIEEIRADAGAMYGMWTREPSLEENVPYAEQIIGSYTAPDADRFYRERLLLPTAARELDASARCRPPWNALSWELADPWAFVSGRLPDGESYRTEPLPVDALLRVETLNRFLSDQGVTHTSRRDAVQSEYVMPSMLRFKPPGAAYEDQAMTLAVAQAHAAAVDEEITHELARTSTVGAWVDAVIDRFPGSSRLAGVLSDRLATSDQERAVELATRAAVLASGNPAAWRRLRLRLNEWGRPDDARLADLCASAVLELHLEALETDLAGKG
jgi:hypothetical protein